MLARMCTHTCNNHYTQYHPTSSLSCESARRNVSLSIGRYVCETSENCRKNVLAAKQDLRTWPVEKKKLNVSAIKLKKQHAAARNLRLLSIHFGGHCCTRVCIMGWMEHTQTHIKYSDRESKGFRFGRLLFIKFKESLR